MVGPFSVSIAEHKEWKYARKQMRFKSVGALGKTSETITEMLGEAFLRKNKEKIE